MTPTTLRWESAITCRRSTCMNDDATINEKGGKYAGMDRYEARKAMVEDLEEQGLLVKVVPHPAITSEPMTAARRP